MTRFAIVSPPVTGHVNPFCVIGRELIRRGHRVAIFHMSDLEPKARAEGLDFVAIGEADHPPGTLRETLSTIGSLSGLAAMCYTVSAAARSTEMFLRDLPQALERHGIQALLVDQMEPAGATVAEHLGLPFVTICNALALNSEDGVPPPFTNFAFSDTWTARLRNRVGYRLGRKAIANITAVTNRYRAGWSLQPYKRPDDSFSPLAQLSQQPSAFDFPRRELPAQFHYLGPFRDAFQRISSFPWHQLDGRPLVYASLGSLQGSKLELFRTFADACSDVEVQAVISHGGLLSAEAVASLPGSHLVVSYAPQYEVIRKAQATLTHAGLNTVLDSLSHGVPLVAIPLTYEQPAIAQRVQWTGVGEILAPAEASRAAVRKALTRVLESSTYKQQAGSVQRSIQLAGGVSRAVDIIESVVTAPEVSFHTVRALTS